jgi:hypothetical protein
VYADIGERVIDFSGQAIQKPAVLDDRLYKLKAVPDWKWRCGDYAFYILYDYIKHYRYCWLIEHDVLINFASAASFFDKYNNRHYDLIAAHYALANPSWSWHSRMRRYSERVYQSLFPVVRIATSKIPLLQEMRETMSLDDVADLDFPNDESFVATALTSNGCLCHDLNFDDAQVYTTESFSLLPKGFVPLRNKIRDNLLYHPCVDFSGLLSRARWHQKYNNNHAALSLLLHELEICLPYVKNDPRILRALSEIIESVRKRGP